MPIQEHGVPAEIKSNINFKPLTSALEKIGKQNIALVIDLYLVWKKENNRLSKLKVTKYGKVGYTIGKFIGEWVESMPDLDIQKSAKSLKNQVEAMNRVAVVYKPATITNFAMLARLDADITAKKNKGKAVVKEAPSVRFNREKKEKAASVLRKAGFTDREVASLLAFGALGNK